MSKSKMIILRTRFPAGQYMAASKTPQLHGTTYDYFYIPKEGEVIKEGDFAVVDVAANSHGDGGMKVVRIMGTLTRSSKAEKHALAVFSLDAYQERRERADRINDLREEILQRAEEARERTRLLALAENDEGLAALLKELDELQAQ